MLVVFFWVIMLFIVVFGGISYRSPALTWAGPSAGGLMLLEIILLGIRVFGNPLT
jgi:hypothetical protein